jgi:predicted RNA-binding Zn-ribbon protein involved in translation (DUF1610 family)
MPECVSCGDEYNRKRYLLGYTTCLECGETSAQKEKRLKSRRTAPLYNKGAAMYITSINQVRDLGR